MKMFLMPLSVVLMIALIPTAQAITVEELAAQFETYKKEQAVKFARLSSENITLKQQNQALKNKIEQTLEQVDNNTVAVEVVSENYAAVGETAEWFNHTSIGGYGELHYQNRSKAEADHQEEVDFHRFVLFFGHEFNDDLRFFSELELEHSFIKDTDNGSSNGEVELEQAYLEYDFNDNISAKAGLFLMPVGIINETHEPNTFYGVERNEVEKNIIPTTWWEAGLGGSYRFANGLSFDAVISSGLEVDSSGKKAFSIRSGRGKVSKQKANDPIIVFRSKYTGIPGLELAASILHQTDLGQSGHTNIGSGTLYETHAIYSHNIGPGTLTGKALYSRWEIEVNNPSYLAAETQVGWYLEPSYRLPSSIGDLGFYGRFQKLDYYSGTEKKYHIWETGMNWWVHEKVALKADYIYKEDTVSHKDERGFDFGIGYQF